MNQPTTGISAIHFVRAFKSTDQNQGLTSNFGYSPRKKYELKERELNPEKVLIHFVEPMIQYDDDSFVFANKDRSYEMRMRKAPFRIIYQSSRYTLDDLMRFGIAYEEGDPVPMSNEDACSARTSHLLNNDFRREHLMFAIQNRDGHVKRENYYNYFEAKRKCIRKQVVVAFWSDEDYNSWERDELASSINDGFTDEKGEAIFRVECRYFYISENYRGGYEEVHWGTKIFKEQDWFVYDPYSYIPDYS